MIKYLRKYFFKWRVQMIDPAKAAKIFKILSVDTRIHILLLLGNLAGCSLATPEDHA